MHATHVNRRRFLGDCSRGIALASLIPTVGSAEERAETIARAHDTKDADRDMLDRKGLVQSLLVALNPTVVSALVSPVVYLIGVSRMVHTNLKRFEAGELDRDKMIYNNADKFSGVFLEIALVTITALGRAGVNALSGAKVGFLSPRHLSEIESVTAYHAHSALYVYLYNPLQSALRHAYIQALTKHAAFQGDPRKVPLTVVAAELDSFSGQMTGEGISEETRTKLSAMAAHIIDIFFADNPSNLPLTEAVVRDLRRILTPRGLLDMLSIGLSYYATIQGNFAFGRLAGLPARFGLYTRDMLERIERQGCPPVQQDEELQSSISYALNSAANNLHEGLIQLLADRGLGLQSHQRSDVAATHLREILGVVLSGLLFFELQAVLERRVRSAVEQTPQSPLISLAKRYLRP